MATSATLVVLSIVGTFLVVEEEDLEDFWPHAWTHGLSMVSIMLVTIDDGQDLISEISWCTYNNLKSTIINVWLRIHPF